MQKKNPSETNWNFPRLCSQWKATHSINHCRISLHQHHHPLSPHPHFTIIITITLFLCFGMWPWLSDKGWSRTDQSGWDADSVRRVNRACDEFITTPLYTSADMARHPHALLLLLLLTHLRPGFDGRGSYKPTPPTPSTFSRDLTNGTPRVSPCGLIGWKIFLGDWENT